MLPNPPRKGSFDYKIMPTGVYKRIKPAWNKGKKCPQLSNSQKGRIPWNKGTKGIMKPNSGSFKKGQKLSSKIIEKRASKLRGRKRPPFSKEWKNKIGLGAKGRIISKETRKRMSSAHKGRKFSEIAKFHMREAKLNQTEETRKKISIGRIKHYDKVGRIIKRPYYHLSGSLYGNWKKSIFEYDNYICWVCEIKEEKLNAHHLKEWIQYPTLRYVKSNGIVLCEICHKIYGYHRRKKRLCGVLDILSGFTDAKLKSAEKENVSI